MKTEKIKIEDADGNKIEDSHALVWGNNASWICPDCGELNGNWTGNDGYQVQCDCEARFEIVRGKTGEGNYHLAKAIGVRKV